MGCPRGERVICLRGKHPDTAPSVRSFEVLQNAAVPRSPSDHRTFSVIRSSFSRVRRKSAVFNPHAAIGHLFRNVGGLDTLARVARRKFGSELATGRALIMCRCDGDFNVCRARSTIQALDPAVHGSRCFKLRLIGKTRAVTPSRTLGSECWSSRSIRTNVGRRTRHCGYTPTFSGCA
jgi:hypothetical protein